MYGYINTNDTHYGTYSYTDDHYYGGHVPLPTMVVAAPETRPPPLAVPDSLSPLKSEFGYSSSEYGSPSSAASYGIHTEGYYPIVSSTTGRFLDLDSNPVRRVFSTGDLQGVNLVQRNNRSESPLASESNMIIEGMNKACRYSPEEKKERIERYRTKRNLRNFTKKIKVRNKEKTLADSRPRIRGRFARNDEPCDQRTIIHQSGEWNIIEDDDGDMDEETWINLQLIDDFNFQQI